MIMEIKERFKLSEKFLEQYKDKQPNWGPLGYITYKRTYAKYLTNENRTEEWHETVQRVVEGCYTIQLNHCRRLHLPWQPLKAMASAREMYRLMWEFKFLPAGRVLANMGSDFIYERGSAALFNCSAVTTGNITNQDFSYPFIYMMDMSMCGVGVGFDTRGSNKVTIKQPKFTDEIFIVPDSKEGWCECVKLLLDSYIGKNNYFKFDFSNIRPAGAEIVTSGGIAPGPEPLIRCVEEITELLNSKIGNLLSSVDIVDLMNIIGKCVVSGGKRRSAQLALGFHDDEAYLEMKDPSKYSDLLTKHRWASNNSVYAEIGMDYTKLGEQTAKNGEPGYVWLENMKQYGRMKDGACNADPDVILFNPCAEVPLLSEEHCNISDMFPAHHDNLEDFKKTAKYAYLLCKTITLIPTHIEQSNAVMLSNRRIGLSQSGIIQAINKLGMREYFNWCDSTYNYVKHLDEKYSRWLCIPRSIKISANKPAGTTSLLPGATPGVHYPHSRYYKRAIRIDKNSNLLKPLKKAGYEMEESLCGDNTYVVYFPVEEKNYKQSKDDVSIWQQVELISNIQHYWSDNAVSATVTFKSEEAKDIPMILSLYETKLKSISFLPLSNHGFKQAPYQTITEEVYNEMVKKIKPLDLSNLNDTNEVIEKFCDGDNCIL